MAINYGLNKVRFVTPVRSGARIRARSSVGEVSRLDRDVQVEFRTTIEIEGSEKPACVAEVIARFIA
ncbi:acyl dehydratase [Rhodococcus sp. BE178]